jgi:hypothetical protein
MLPEQETKFLQYWEQNRERENTFLRKLTGGMPMALIFSMPIVLSVVVVRLFLPEWYTKISKTSPGTFITIIFAMIIVALFYSFFRMQYKWEMNEQLYKELKAKENSINKTTDFKN